MVLSEGKEYKPRFGDKRAREHRAAANKQLKAEAEATKQRQGITRTRRPCKTAPRKRSPKPYAKKRIIAMTRMMMMMT
jgi:hypothetical protein